MPGSTETASETVDVDGPALTVPPHLTIQRTAGVGEQETSPAEEMVEPLGVNKQKNSGPSTSDRDEGLFHQPYRDLPISSSVMDRDGGTKVPLPTEVVTEPHSTAVVEFDRHLFLLELLHDDDQEIQKPAPTLMVTSSDLPEVSDRPVSAPKIAGELDSWMSSGFPYDMVITPGPAANRWPRMPAASATAVAQPAAGRLY